jgi:DNA-binding CsgD family transcriptional regulator
VNFKNLYPIIILVAATLFFAYDIIADLAADDENLLHVFIESMVFLAIITVLFRELRRLGQLKTELSDERVRTARLSGELLAVMRNQFTDWGLSPSESEVALLLIKGLSMKEIAEARQVKEKTVRQQATGIYAKSGYAGRHELVAHFIEDLMSNSPDQTRFE